MPMAYEERERLKHVCYLSKKGINSTEDHIFAQEMYRKYLAPWAKWFAVDVDGSQAFYSFEPQCTYSRLWRIAANSPEFSVYCSFNMQHKVKLPKNTDWRNTLTPRPEGM